MQRRVLRRHHDASLAAVIEHAKAENAIIVGF